MVIIESVKPTKIEEKKETAIDLEKELPKMIEQPTDKQDGEREKQNNEESKKEYKNEMKEKETENTKVKAEEVCDSMKEALDMVFIELDRIKKSTKQSFVHEKFIRAYREYRKALYPAYQEYKDGLRHLSALVICYKDIPSLRKFYEERRRKFEINVAAACIKIIHYQHGLDDSNLVLEKPSDDNQYKKAIYRAGECYRGLGDFENASKTFRKLLNENDLDGLVRRSILRQLKGIVVQEKKRNKEMARGMMSGKGDNLIEPEKKQDSPEDLRISEEIEERRHAYLANEKNRDMPQNKDPEKRNISAPEIMITEEEYLFLILDTLVELYADRTVQDELKQAMFDHTKGFIIRFRLDFFLMPLQRDVLEKCGFLNFND